MLKLYEKPKGKFHVHPHQLEVDILTRLEMRGIAHSSRCLHVIYFLRIIKFAIDRYPPLLLTVNQLLVFPCSNPADRSRKINQSSAAAL
jgi:hypothetical protein